MAYMAASKDCQKLQQTILRPCIWAWNILNAKVDDQRKGNHTHTFKRAAFTNKHKWGCSPFTKNKKKKKKNRIPYSKPEQVAIYLEIQGNSSSPTPLLFFPGMLAKMQLEDIRKESIFNLKFDYIPFQAKTSLQLEIFIKKDTHYEQPTSRSIV